MSSATIVTSVVTGGSNNHATVSEEANAYATDFVTQGVLGSITNTNGSAPMTGSFGINQDTSPDMGVTILGTSNTTSTQSIGYVTCSPASQDIQVLRARMASNYTAYTINANATGSTVYDFIYLQASATNAATPDAAADNVITLYTSRSTINTSDNGSPPTYGTLLAVVTVANGASSITNANISDRRTQVALTAGATSTGTGWSLLSFPLTYGANNGNKEFTVTTPNNLTGVLSPGMKLQVTRSVTPPTQCMAFVAASSQYATKASPSGISFTAAFTCEAWVYLTAYPASSQYGGVIGRSDDTTGGFELVVKDTGQVRLYYAASSAFTDFVSFQSIPLNQWVHIAGVATSLSSKTGAIYINGTSVAVSSVLSSTTSLTQTSNLSVGGIGAGVANRYFNGYISEARIWSVAQSAANVQANMAISLVGNETNLVALYQGNGVFTDATSNANNLTATGGAIATQAANPYNIIEYAILVAISYSNPTTTLTLYTNQFGTIPNQTLNNPGYSIVAEPFGYPSGLTEKRIVYLMISSQVTSTIAQVAGLSLTFTAQAKPYKITLYAATVQVAGAAYADLSIWDGVVNSGTKIGQATGYMNGGNYNLPFIASTVVTPVAGSKTYNAGLDASASTVLLIGSTTAPSYLLIEPV